jgi:DNA-binding response OmpR family regulator
MDVFRKLSKMKMLLIDDDEWIRDSLRIFLESQGCSLVALETAEEGLVALAGQSFDIIIADYRLPGMNGLEFLKQANRTAREKRTIKILITAYGNDQIRSEVNKLGIHDFIAKPFSTRTIEASLSKLIKSR